MKIDFKYCDSSLQRGEKLKRNLYKKFNQYSFESKFWIRLTGVGVATASAAITLATKVSYFAETLFKSFANIFGARFSKEMNAKRGFKQLFDRVPDAAFQLAYSPLYIVTSFVLTTLQMLFDPRNYTANRKEVHELEYRRLELVDANYDNIKLNSFLI